MFNMKKLAGFLVVALIFSSIGFFSSPYIIRALFDNASNPGKSYQNPAGPGEDAKVEERSKKLPDDVKIEPSDTEPAPAPEVDAASLPEKFNIKWEVWSGNKQVQDYKRGETLSFGNSAAYSDVEGVTSFRGNNYRNAPGYGFVDLKEGKLEKAWSIKIGYIDTWTGVGWTGQPAIVKWSDKVKNLMNINAEKKKKPQLKEVIYATLDGNIYFLDLDDGLATRPPINVGSPHKGSVSVDPRGYPLLYAGQGIEQVAGKHVPTGYRIFSLIDQRLLHFIDGYDPFALRKWPAFDSGSLLDKKTDTLVEIGENGVIYTLKLNTKFDVKKKSISINPETAKYRYVSPRNSQLGTENSPVIYKNFIYFADNSGLLHCVDLNTFKPVWTRYVNDDTDSSLVLEEYNDSEVYLYTACEVDKQGENGSSYIRKINALTGELLWEKAYKCFYDSYTNGGTLASPVIGKQEIQNLVIFNIARTGSKTGGKLVAFDKKTGREVWVINLKYYCWSSPVDVYTKEGKAYLIVCDSGGFMSLVEAKTGRIMDRIPLEGTIEASPAVYNDMVVVGTRGQKIWGVRIK